MSLNQRGLFGGVVRSVKDPSVKTNEGSFTVLFSTLSIYWFTDARLCIGHLLACETEKEILDILEVPWQEPHERVRANVV